MNAPHLTPDHRQAFSALIDAAGPLDWRALLSALRGPFTHVLGKSHRLPGELIEAVFELGDAELLRALAGNAELRRDPDARRRLAAGGHPAVALACADDRDLRRTVLENADPSHPGWHGETGAITRLCTEKDPRVIRSFAYAPFTRLLEHVLDIAAGELSERELAYALAGLRRHSATDNARTWAELIGGPVASRAIVELEAGGDLSGLLDWADGTECAVRELRPGGRGDLEWRVSLRPVLDWAAIDAAHAAEPFDERAARALVARADCPPETVARLHDTHPLAIAEDALAFDEGIWRGEKNATAAVLGKSAAVLTRRAFELGIPAGLITAARPATAILAAMRPERTTSPDHPAFAELERLTAEQLGDDPAAWRALRSVLRSAPGPVGVLFGTVWSVVNGNGAPPSWPYPAEAPADGKSGVPSGARAAFLTVFDCATVEVRRGLLPHLDERTRFDVFTRAVFEPYLADAAVEGGERFALMLAARPTLEAGTIQRLLELDSPAVNSRLFNRTGATPEQRRAILSGHRFGPGEGIVPLDPALRERLLAKQAGWHPTEAVECADAELQEHILLAVRVRGDLPQLRLLLNAWKWHGRERALHLISDELKPASYSRRPIGRTAKSRLRKLAALSDPAAALAEARAQVDASTTAEWQIAELRRDRDNPFELARHSHPWRWAEIIAAHRAEALPPKMLAAMRDMTSGLPAELGEAADAQANAWDGPLTKPGGALRRLKEKPLDEGFVNGQWVPLCLASGQLTPGDLVRHGFPAMRALALAAPHLSEDPGPLSALLEETVDGRPDAWLLTLRILPEFTGTVPELLATATAATD
ncbi:hypothetical protein AB0I28_08185 [Phytomonospora sp. NPDC050363]|uniref:hypothetical protein n=1 Tax=Phytomonospora sp. NPDC050363 TaxID=3155642 RepID=UPI0033D34992